MVALLRPLHEQTERKIAVTDYITQYLPSAWLDEVNPIPQQDPSAFLARAPVDGAWMMKAVEDGDWNETFYHTPVEHGQIVPFLAFRQYGDHIMTVDENGRASAATVPADANCFTLDNEDETFNDSPQDLADNGFEATGDPLPAGSYEIQAWFWADTETHFRAVIEGESARFEPCAGPN